MPQPIPPLADTQARAVRARIALAHDNGVAAHIYLNGNPLPGEMVARPEGVYFTVADVDDLDLWLGALGGVIHVGPVFESARPWVLHTALPARSDGTSVAVQVRAEVVTGELVLDSVQSAVAA